MMIQPRRARSPLGIRLARVCAFTLASAMLPGAIHAQTRAWMDTTVAPAKRASMLVAAMTQDEKLQQLAMQTGPNPDMPDCAQRRDTRHIEGIPRLGIPTLRAINGPIGVSGGDCSPDRQATGLPTGLAVAATWNVSAAQRWGDIAGREVRANGHHMYYAPGLNLARIAQAGRNFEYFGEDPYLSGVMGTAETAAGQAHGIQVTIKHFVANEQETKRTTMNVVVDDRTLHELYLLPFEMAIRDARPSSVMCSYPRINGVFACESQPVMRTILRDQLGFKGYVVSDRGATNSTAASIKAGLNLELNSIPRWFTAPLLNAALSEKRIAIADVDARLIERFTTVFTDGLIDHPVSGTTRIDFQSHGNDARRIAEEGIVLLKNANGILPLEAKALRRIAVIGPKRFAGAAKLPATGPGGILTVVANYTVTPERGLRNALASLDASATVTYDDGTNIARAAALAAQSDVAIVMVGDISLEGVDRDDLMLPVIDSVKQEELVPAIARANARTIVVLKDGGPVLMPWLGSVPAVLEAWYPGQEDGNAVANVLFGIVSPSGRLPLTFPAQQHDAASATASQFPGVMVDSILTSTYTEKLEMGYRWYDAKHAEPLFPFGHGLSYTTFRYSTPKLSTTRSDGRRPITVTFTLTNTGDRPGAEVPQLYAGFAPRYGEPPKRLVAFDKVWLNPGESRVVSLTVDPARSSHPLSYWDAKAQRWSIMSGPVDLQLARSAREIEAHLALVVANAP